jgi:hypothetical protein
MEAFSTVSIWLGRWGLIDAYLVYLVGPGPILGYDEQGNPTYEGTPVHVIAGFIGLLLGVPIYSMISYYVLWAIMRLRSEGPV